MSQDNPQAEKHVFMSVDANGDVVTHEIDRDQLPALQAAMEEIQQNPNMADEDCPVCKLLGVDHPTSPNPGPTPGRAPAFARLDWRNKMPRNAASLARRARRAKRRSQRKRRMRKAS